MSRLCCLRYNKQTLLSQHFLHLISILFLCPYALLRPIAMSQDTKGTMSSLHIVVCRCGCLIYKLCIPHKRQIAARRLTDSSRAPVPCMQFRRTGAPCTMHVIRLFSPMCLSLVSAVLCTMVTRGTMLICCARRRLFPHYSLLVHHCKQVSALYGNNHDDPKVLAHTELYNAHLYQYCRIRAVVPIRGKIVLNIVYEMKQVWRLRKHCLNVKIICSNSQNKHNAN